MAFFIFQCLFQNLVKLFEFDSLTFEYTEEALVFCGKDIYFIISGIYYQHFSKLL